MNIYLHEIPTYTRKCGMTSSKNSGDGC